MKKIIFSATICLLMAINVFSQDWSYDVYSVGRKYPGYIIKTDGTKTEGYIKAQARAGLEGVGSSNQNSVEFYTDPENKKTKVVYKPEDLKEYKIAEKVYRSMNYSGGLTSKPVRFLLLVQDGAIARYSWYDHEGYEPGNTIPPTPHYVEKVIYQKGSEKPFEESSFLLGFSKKMSALVSDYPELATKVTNEEKGYKLLSIREIIAEYNAWYSKK